MAPLTGGSLAGGHLSSGETYPAALLSS